ncbi:MAG: SURF1 family protein [Wenzhouxiangellaceae bacterium]
MTAIRSLIPHLAALAVIGGCIWLAAWQLDRAEFKRELIERHQAMAAIDLNTSALPETLPTRVTALGRWDAARQVLIDNQMLDGRAGVFVLTPLVLEDGRLLLVNRGWAAWPSRAEPPPDPKPETEVADIIGVLNEPPRVGRAPRGRDALTGDQWPLLATWFDHAALADRLDAELSPVVIQLAPEHPAHLTGRAWTIVSFGPQRHLGYALTWATMAVTVFIIWLALSLRARRRKTGPATRPSRESGS